MKTLNITTPIQVTDPFSRLDANYGPYISATQAYTAIPKALRQKGMVIGIIQNQ